VGDQIKTVNTDGTGKRTLTTGWNPTVKPQSDVIFVKTVGGIKQIFAVNLDGTGLKRLTNFAADPPTLASPCFSPDGQTIAFWLDQGSGINVWLMNANGSNLRQLTFNNEAFVGNRLEFSPAMDRLYYRRTTGPGAASIWRVGLDGQNNGLFNDFSGNEYAVVFVGTDYLLYHVNGGGIYRTTSLTDLTPSLLIAGGEMPALNRARTKIAYRSQTSTISIANINATSPVPVASEPGLTVLDPNFSSDGNAVVYCVGDQIKTVKNDGTDNRNLTTGWNPNSHPFAQPTPRDKIVGVGNISSTFHPGEFHLFQNYPNPFNPSTTIGFSLPSRSRVTLRVYNVIGQLVSTLVDGELTPGSHSTAFDGTGLPSGVYLYRLTAGSFSETKRLVLLK
jgi:WD40 repeat protein